MSGSPYDGTAFGFFFIPAKPRVKSGAAIEISEYLADESGEGNKEVQQKLTVPADDRNRAAGRH